MTITARGDHGGYMQHNDNEGKHLYTNSDLQARIRTALGGRAAEPVYYCDVTPIYSNDILLLYSIMILRIIRLALLVQDAQKI